MCGEYKKVCEVKAKNELLKQDNERMERELNNNSGNSSLPSSSDLPGKAPNTYNARAKSNRAKGGQKDHKGRSLTKADVDRMLASGKPARFSLAIHQASSTNTIQLSCAHWASRPRIHAKTSMP